MERNELKKYLYKNKPLAKIDNVSRKGIVYKLEVPDTFIYFLIPLTELEYGTFNYEMEAQFLIRYIYE